MSKNSKNSKKQILSELLCEGMVLIALDARSPGVDVPVHLSQDPQLRLNLSYRFGLPLQIADEGIHATLTFTGIPYVCKVPWNAIFLIVSHTSGQPYLFPNEIPSQLLEIGSEKVPAHITPIPVPVAAKPRRNHDQRVQIKKTLRSSPIDKPKLTLVVSNGEPIRPKLVSDHLEPVVFNPTRKKNVISKRRRCHLRLVK